MWQLELNSEHTVRPEGWEGADLSLLQLITDQLGMATDRVLSNFILKLQSVMQPKVYIKVFDSPPQNQTFITSQHNSFFFSPLTHTDF